MGRKLIDIFAELPPKRQAAIDARYRELKGDVEGLRALRQVAGKAQSDVARALNIKQPSVSKIERQVDMYLSTLRSYIEAVGGELELVVRLPDHRPLRLRQIGDVFASAQGEKEEGQGVALDPPKGGALWKPNWAAPPEND